MNIILLIVMILNPLQKKRFFDYWGYSPGPKQALVHYEGIKYRFIAVKGGNRSGKSWLAGYEGAVSIQVPNTPMWCVAPSYDLAEKVYRVIKDYGVDEIGYPLLIDKNTPPQLKIPTGSHVWAKSTEKLASLEGEGVKKMIVDEFGFMKKLVWQRLVVRLDREQAQCIIIFTPKGKNIFTRKFWTEKLRDPNWLCVEMPTDEQPYVDQEFIEMAENELGGRDSPSYREQIRGEFVPYGLLVYAMFNQTHIGKKKIDNKWRFVIGIDAGYVHPCVASFWAISKSDFCYKMAEYDKNYLTDKKNAEGIIAQAITISKQFKKKFDVAFYDPSDPALAEEIREVAKKEKYQIRILPANNDVNARIELERQLMHGQKLLINSECEKTIDNYMQYSHKENSEKVQKICDDHCDADGYALLGHFDTPRKRYTYKVY